MKRIGGRRLNDLLKTTGQSEDISIDALWAAALSLELYGSAISSIPNYYNEPTPTPLDFI
jgi:hypothetical protein